ncbi:hypothetical protein SAMN04487821_102217 [Enterococcus malodoratus]|uniref:CPBP family intramembrane glutamic endopeptidase n=1 Tax=Enterococcus malodoratus TaxID=71451 RepID=UPI0008D0E0D4|nr:type II CAAX endopeptidase family protein [Enterococcus malodoratus]SES76887.1 hypothetical protein SAMN04487821_102217 [Enterococcus malodoratus]
MREKTSEGLSNILTMLGLAGIYLLLYTVLIFLIQSSYNPATKDFSGSSSLLICLFGAGSSIVLLRQLKKSEVPLYNPTFSVKKTIGVIVLGCLVKLLFILSMATLITKNSESMASSEQTLSQMMQGLPFAVSIFIFCVCTPIMEEVVFRGGIMSVVFKNRLIIGIIVSSLIFASFHLPQNLFEWILYIGAGLILGLSYGKTNQLFIPFAIHFFTNLFSSYI